MRRDSRGWEEGLGAEGGEIGIGLEKLGLVESKCLDLWDIFLLYKFPSHLAASLTMTLQIAHRFPPILKIKYSKQVCIVF